MGRHGETQLELTHGEVEALLRLCALRRLQNEDTAGFIDQVAREGPAVFPEVFDRLPLGHQVPRVERERFFRSFAFAAASSFPLPWAGWQPQPLPLPEAAAVCLCGSGRPFAGCCGGWIEPGSPFPADVLGALLIARLPRKAWAALPQQGVSPVMAMLAAHEMRSERGDLAAAALIEPWAALPAPWSAERAPLLDLLCDIYLDLHKPRKRRSLAQTMVERGDAVVQSFGWRRLSMMAADRGDRAAAHEAFERAQRLTPDDPDVALLEVTTLLGADEAERARERAAFHARRLARMAPDEDRTAAVRVLQRIARGETPPFDEPDAPGAPGPSPEDGRA